MRTNNLYLRSILLILVLCCLLLPVYAQNGGSADSYVRAYESGLEMLASTPLMNGERLEDIRKLFEQSDTYALGAEYLSYVNALIVLQTGNANRYDEALESIRRLQKNEKFSMDYNSRLDQSNRPALTDLEQYVKARKLEAFGDTQGALALYDAYPVLDAVTRANLLSISFKLSKYEEASSLFLEGTLESVQLAAVLFEELGDFRDSPKRLQECRDRKPTPTPKMPKVGDTVFFGHYEQDNNLSNGKELIQWIVIDVDSDNNKALLLAYYALDCIPFNTTSKYITWENSTMRSWLNRDFFNIAFSPGEKEVIRYTLNYNQETYLDISPYAENDTWDNVFLLSYSQSRRVSSDDSGWAAKATLYAKARGAGQMQTGFTSYWLRTHGVSEDTVLTVYNPESSAFSSEQVNDKDTCVRPALWLDLASYIF